jgi:hypothetical protein
MAIGRDQFCKLDVYHSQPMKPLAKRLLFSGLTTTFQITTYWLVFYIGAKVGTEIHQPTRMSIYELTGFAAMAKLSIITFGIIAVVINVIDATMQNKRLTWILVTFATVGGVAFWLPQVSYIPYKSVLFTVAGVTGLYSKFIIENLLRRDLFKNSYRLN